MPFFTFHSTFLIAALDSPVSVGWWLLFGLLMSVLVGIDLLTLHRRARDPSMSESAITVAIWCLLAIGFNGIVWFMLGGEKSLQFTTGYLLEWSMSMDNVFVFAVIFRYFQVPKQHQYRILFWGILGAVLMRLGFILAGTALIARFQFILPLFGLFLIYTAYRLAWHSAEQIDPSRTLIFRFAHRWLPLAKGEGNEAGSGEQGAGSRGQGEPRNLPDSQHYDGRFVVRQKGRLRITPLLLVLLIVESTDLLFAADSVPAIFGITRDPFIIFTSNVFAILGLRALYFLLAGVMDSFRYLHYGLAAVLAFVGLKMVAEGWLGHAGNADHVDILPPWASLVIIAAILSVAIAASIVAKRKEVRS